MLKFRIYSLILCLAFTIPALYAQSDISFPLFSHGCTQINTQGYNYPVQGIAGSRSSAQSSIWEFTAGALLLYPKTGFEESFETSFGIGASILKSISDKWKAGTIFMYAPLSSVESPLEHSDLKSDGSLLQIGASVQYTLFQEFTLSAFTGFSRYAFLSSTSSHTQSSGQTQDIRASAWHWTFGAGPCITVIRSSSFDLTISMQYYAVLTSPHTSCYFLTGLSFSYIK